MRWALVIAAVVTRLNCPAAFEWTIDVSIGDNARFLCNDSAFNPNDTDTVRWYRERTTGEVIEIVSGDKYSLRYDGIDDMVLDIHDVTTEDFGIYRCDIAVNGTDIVRVRKGLNLAGRLYDSLLEKYRRQLEMAGIASSSVLLLFVVTCLVHKFWYREPRFGTGDLYGRSMSSIIGIPNPGSEAREGSLTDMDNAKEGEQIESTSL